MAGKDKNQGRQAARLLPLAAVIYRLWTMCSTPTHQDELCFELGERGLGLIVFTLYMGDPGLHVWDVTGQYLQTYRGCFKSQREAEGAAFADVREEQSHCLNDGQHSFTPEELADFRRKAADGYDIVQVDCTFYLFKKPEPRPPLTW